MKLRKATFNDFFLIQKNYLDAIRHPSFTNGDVWNECYPLNMTRQDIEKDVLYIVEDKNEIIGSFVLSFASNDKKSELLQPIKEKELINCKYKNPSAKRIFLERFLIVAKFQGQGYGKKVLYMAINESRRLKAEYITLFVAGKNNVAINLYKKFGFLECGSPFLVPDEIDTFGLPLEKKIL